MTYKTLSLLCILIVISSITVSADPNSDLKTAELVGQSYMRAFFHGDAEEAVNYMLPEVLIKIKAAMIAALDVAVSQGQEKELLATKLFYNGDAQGFRNLTPVENFSQIIKANHTKAGAAADAMKLAKVDIISSALVESDEATVCLQITVPRKNGSTIENTTLSLIKFQGLWKVRGNTNNDNCTKKE